VLVPRIRDPAPYVRALGEWALERDSEPRAELPGVGERPQTRDLGARKRILFSMRSVLVIVGNLLVAFI